MNNKHLVSGLTCLSSLALMLHANAHGFPGYTFAFAVLACAAVGLFITAPRN